jgi:molybdopterin-biosynthesis enzyme MoeA-like protein
MTEERIWTAGLLVIGDEILSGRTQDRNVGQIATWLNLQGIRLAEVRVDRRGGERASRRL